MYNSVFPLQRSSSLGRTMHPRVAYCSVVWKPGPSPPILQPPPALHISTAQYENGSCEVEHNVLRMIDTMRARQEREAAERTKRAEIAAARALREDEELRDAELKAAFERADAVNNAPQPVNQSPSTVPINRDLPSTVRVAAPVSSSVNDRVRRLEQSFNNQKAAVRSFEQHIPAQQPSSLPSHISPSSSPSPVHHNDIADHAVNNSNSQSTNLHSAAVQEFQNITGVTDRAAAARLLSLCDNDLDRSVGLYFDSGQIQDAVDRAIVLNERRQQH